MGVNLKSYHWNWISLCVLLKTLITTKHNLFQMIFAVFLTMLSNFVRKQQMKTIGVVAFKLA